MYYALNEIHKMKLLEQNYIDLHSLYKPLSEEEFADLKGAIGIRKEQTTQCPQDNKQTTIYIHIKHEPH